MENNMNTNQNMNPGNNSASRENLLRQIQSYHFTAYDLNLYLNTHPYDKKALRMHKEINEKAREAVDKFQSMYGPLTANASNNTESWDWVEDPWPWEE